MNEEVKWKVIRDFPNYRISSDGQVENIKRNKKLKQSDRGNGYLCLSLYNKGKDKLCLVHRLVAEAFIPNPENKSQVDHIDGNKRNNNASNLRWVTPSENCRNPITLSRSVDNLRKITSTIEYRHRKSKIHSSPVFWEKYRKSYERVWEMHKRKIRCVETGKIWNSCEDLAKEIRMSHQTISNYCKGESNCKKIIQFNNGTIVNNPHFEFIEDEKIIKYKCRKIKCIETGQVWDSSFILSKILKVSANSVKRYCRGERTCNKTVTFEDGTIISNPHFEYVTTEDYGGNYGKSL